jgi:hypothetical protein
MKTTPSEQRKAQQAASKDDSIQYVEELAGPDEYPEGDAWISLTDAARITRTSEAMTRRWVTSGRLKVKKEPVGIPSRTRLVRLSDVAKIRPIVDPTAAISGEVRKLDLPSIPRQQLQIMQDHQRLTKQVELVLEASKQHEASTYAALLELTTGLRELREEFRHQLSTQHDELQRILEGAEQQHVALAAQVHDQAQQQNNQAQATLQEAQQALERRATEHSSRMDEVRRDLVQQQEALVTLRRDMTTLVEQQGRDVLTTLEQLSNDQARDVADLHARLEQIERRLEQVATQAEAVQITVDSYQKRADGQDRLINTLTRMLQDETEARKTLSEQLAAQQGLLQALRREVEGPKRRKAES